MEIKDSNRKLSKKIGIDILLIFIGLLGGILGEFHE